MSEKLLKEFEEKKDKQHNIKLKDSSVSHISKIENNKFADKLHDFGTPSVPKSEIKPDDFSSSRFTGSVKDTSSSFAQKLNHADVPNDFGTPSVPKAEIKSDDFSSKRFAGSVKDTSSSFTNKLNHADVPNDFGTPSVPKAEIKSDDFSSRRFAGSVKDTSKRNNLHSNILRDSSVSNISKINNNKIVLNLKNEIKHLEFSKQNDDTTDGTIIGTRIKGLKFEYRVARGVLRGTKSGLNILKENSGRKTKLINITKGGSLGLTKGFLKYTNEEIRSFKPQSDDITLNTLVKTKDNVYTSVKTVKTTAKGIQNGAKIIKSTYNFGSKVTRNMVANIGKIVTFSFKLAMPILPYALSLFLVFFLIYSFLTGFSIALLSTHQANLETLNEIYKYSTEVETDTLLSFKNYNYKAHNAALKEENVTYTNEVDFIDPIILLNVLSAFYCDELTLDKAKLYIDDLYSSMYQISINISSVEVPIEEPEPPKPPEPPEPPKPTEPPETETIYFADIKLKQIMNFETWFRNHSEFRDIDIDYIKSLYEYGFLPYQSNINPFENGFAFSYRYGYREDPNNSNNKQFHNALDIPMPAGTEILSSISGVAEVSYIPENYGWNIIIRNDDTGERIRYGHCQEILVENGSRIKEGDIVATVGTTGATSTGNHLHFEYYLNDVNINSLFVIEQVQ